MIGTSIALLLSGIAAAGSSVAAGKMGSSAAKNAAGAQVDASERASQLNYKASNEATQLQRDMFTQQQKNLQPWLDAGGEAVGTMKDLLGAPTWDKSFNGPKFDQNSVQFDPGFDKRMEASNKVIQRWAASKGISGSGGAANKLMKNAQDFTSNEYDKAFGRQYGVYEGDYGHARDSYLMDYQNFQTNRNDRWDRVAQIAGLGNGATMSSNQLLGDLGTNLSNITLGTAKNAGDIQMGEGNAIAAGNVGSANSWSNALSNITKSTQGYMTLGMLRNPAALKSAQFFQPGYAVT